MIPTIGNDTLEFFLQHMAPERVPHLFSALSELRERRARDVASGGPNWTKPLRFTCPKCGQHYSYLGSVVISCCGASHQLGQVFGWVAKGDPSATSSTEPVSILDGDQLTLILGKVITDAMLEWGRTVGPANRAFRETLARANGGDLDALATLSAKAAEFLQASGDFAFKREV